MPELSDREPPVEVLDQEQPAVDDYGERPAGQAEHCEGRQDVESGEVVGGDLEQRPVAEQLWEQLPGIDA
jgi:hypothetical protein